MAQRDFQVGKVYAAEQDLRSILAHQYDCPIIEIHGSKIVVPAERKFANLDNVTTYVTAVCNTLGVPVPRVRERAGQLAAHYEPSNHVIAVPLRSRWALGEVVILHEIAHGIAKDNPGHGVRYAGTFLELIQQFVGPEAHFILRCLYLDNGVKFDFE